MRFDEKLKTRDELRSILGVRPRVKQVGMAHGCWDVVHAGHIRHLLYLREKADILIASVTADQHVDKGIYRPHTPQDLRAQHLAALEMVDYVLIDDRPTPLESIAALQPDFFAKGHEYRDGALSKTDAESEAVAAYGGKMLFTPGDVTYSSSRIIETTPPSLRHEKLLALMKRAGITFDNLRTVIRGMVDIRVHVVGDMIVDTLVQTTMIGGMGKTPTMSVRRDSAADFVGGAGVVAKHLRAAGAHVRLSCVVGNDRLGLMALEDLRAAGVVCDSVIDQTRPTTNKLAYVCDGYRLLKVDSVDNRSISDDVLTGLTRALSCDTEVVVFSDFRHGIFNRRTIPVLVDSIRAHFRVADSQVASRWGNIAEFVGFDLITPNEREARFALGDQDSGVRMLASALYTQARCRTLILKMGERGVMTCTGHHGVEALHKFSALDSFTDSVVDAVGSGDALLAYATLAMHVSGSAECATILGSVAAALECECDGNQPITPQAVIERLQLIEREATYGPRDQG